MLYLPALRLCATPTHTKTAIVILGMIGTTETTGMIEAIETIEMTEMTGTIEGEAAKGGRPARSAQHQKMQRQPSFARGIWDQR